MEKGKFLKDSQIVVLGICIVVATVFSSLILSQGFFKVMKFSREVITVTGSAQENIKSDYAVWSGKFTRQEADLKTAYEKIKQDMGMVGKYLLSKGVAADSMVFNQVSTDILYKKVNGKDTNEREAYRLSQWVTIKSDDVDKVAEISRKSTELIDQDINFESCAPEYYYSKLDELKIEMLAKATANAKQRAANMAKAAGNKIGLMRSAKMGVFQITPINSTDVSDWGVNDTSSLDKRVTAVVNATFAVE